MDQRLYHFVPAAELAGRHTARGYAPPSLAHEGFVHLSTADQLAATHARFYRDVSDAHLYEIDPTQLSDLRWEDSSGHGVFPHHYGPIPVQAMTDLGLYDSRA